MALPGIDTIVIAIMENRSFDHMLGYLSLDETPDPMAVDGLRSYAAWRDAVANAFDGIAHKPEPMSPAQPLADPPHEHLSIAMQINTPGPGDMRGFVKSYYRYSEPTTPTRLDAVMGYYDGAALPTFDFFARHYCVCDHWFSSVPLGTQANRLMAMAGESRVFDNAPFFLPPQRLVYDWLTEHRIGWCVYQWGGFLPFFALMATWLPEIVTSLTLSGLGRASGRFRRYRRFRKEWLSGEAPNVIFVEPQYTDGPRWRPNDDHPPTGVGRGQEFLADLYRTLIGNPERWARTLLIVTYDEHGGFFDHVPPLPIPTEINDVPLETTGVRVPAFLVSPHVEAGSVSDKPLDHTSILQLLDECFANGAGYSDPVRRRSSTLGRIGDILLPERRPGPVPKLRRNLLAVLLAIVRPVIDRLVRAVAPRAAAIAAPTAPPTPNAIALDTAMRVLDRDYPELLAQPGWEEARAYLRANPVPLAAQTAEPRAI